MESRIHRIAVMYATAQGSTRDIAEFIADDLAGRGAQVELSDIEHAPELSRFDTVVLGSAVHDMALLPAATTYLHTNHTALAATDLWLFSVGLGPALRGPVGRVFARRVPKKIAALRDSVAPHEYRAFAGRYDRDRVSQPARTLHLLMGGGRYGDLRDWRAIRNWSARIAESLGLPEATTSIVQP